MAKGWKQTEEARAKMRLAKRTTGAARRKNKYCGSPENVARLRSNSRTAGLASGRSRYISRDEYAVRQRYLSYQVGSRKIGREFEISLDRFREMVHADCWYCGGPPTSTWRKRDPKLAKLNGIDRFDNDRGYVEGNIVACCGVCNRAKHTAPVDVFIELCKRIAEKHGSHPALKRVV